MVEKHQQKLKFVCIPIKIWKMYNDTGDLSEFQFRLVMLIDSLCHEDSGCWASNAYLAKKMRSSVRHIISTTKELREMGLVREIGTVTIGNLKFNIKETEMSPVKIAAPTLKKQNKLSQAVIALQSKTKKSVQVNLYKLMPQPCEKDSTHELEIMPTHELEIMPTHEPQFTQSISNKELNGNRENKVAHRNGVCSDGFFDRPEKRTPEYLFAQRLDAILREHGKIILRKTNLTKWSIPFRELLKHRSEDQIDSILDWYDENIDNEWCPQKYAAKTFCEDYPKLEEARKRLAQKEQERKYREAKEQQYQ